MEDHHFNHKNQNMLQKGFAKSCEIVNDVAEYFASLSIGQTALKHTDRLLWSLEKSTEWSIPSASAPKHASNGAFGQPAPLVRPLPWLLFLPLLFFLRITRFSLNIASMLMGMESVKASTMVRFIQVRRRRIRALKFLGSRRIRQRRLEQAEKVSWKGTFYSIMSRAMCFQVTNSDMYEEITVGKTNEAQAQTSKPKKPVSGADLKRKYIEILKNNYQDWEDVEDDEELIERITQLADNDNNDPSYVPPEEEEDSATEDDSLSEPEAEEYELSMGSSSSSQKPPLLRPSSLGSFTNETIAEEAEEIEEGDSDSSTVSASDSGDESSQKLKPGAVSVPQAPAVSERSNVNEEKTSQQLSVESGVTSDEYLSPMNSICPSPEPKPEEDVNGKRNTSQNNNKQEPDKLDEKKESESLINKEKSSQDINKG